MLLWLTPAHTDVLVAQAERDSPHETCGLIGGWVQNGVFRAIEIVPLPNITADPVHHFRIDDRALIDTLFAFESRGLSLVGIYHSHPHSAPIPSREDVACAHYRGTPYIVIGREGTKAVLAAWNIQYTTVDPVALHISPDAPLPDDTAHQSTRTLSLAILLSAALAVAFMLIVSLSLLPPAPVLAR
jgi:proteasome lid subunit RPN8/RPN11